MSKKSNYRKEKTQEAYLKVVENVQNIVNTGEYQKFLKFQSKINSYSFMNIVKIFSQFPEASMVYGKNDWEKKGRTVIDNATEIKITAPIPKAYTKKIKEIVDGEEIEKEVTVHYNNYIDVVVYDISETVGEPIPLEDKEISGEDRFLFFEKLKAFSKWPIIEEEMTGTRKGYFSPKNKLIALRKDLNMNEKISVLLHELSHGLYDDFNYKTDRNLSEVFVESIAFIVADYFGLDTSVCSFNYITKWAEGDPIIVIDLGSKIQKCAKQFISKIEKFEMQELEVAA